MRVPAGLAAVPLLVGAAAGLLLVDSVPQRLVLASAAASVFALIAGCGFLALRFDAAVLVAVAVGCGVCGFSMSVASARTLYAPPLLTWWHSEPREGADPVTVVGVLREDAAQSGAGVSLTIDVRAACPQPCRGETSLIRTRGGIRVFVGGTVPPRDIQRWRAGRPVRMPALLRPPSTFRNPGVADDGRAMARREIALTGSVKSASLVEILGPATAIQEAAGEVRAHTRAVLSARVGPLSLRSAAIAVAILIGDRTGLSDDDVRRLQDAGTYHVIAISGGNIAVFTAVILCAARLARVPLRAASLSAIVLLLFYGQIAGGAPSVSRAITAAIIFLAALALDHRGRSMNTIAVAAIAVVAWSPVMVADAGFLLSFAATAAIVLGVPPLLRATSRGRLVVAIAAATACAEIALAPIAATFFSRVTAAGLLVNFAAIPLMTIVQVGSMLLVAVAAFSQLWADRLAIIVHAGAHALVESARFVDVVPWLARDVRAPVWWLCIAYYGACLGLLIPGTRRPAAVLLAGAMCCLVAGPRLTSRGLEPLPAPGVLRVVVLDVGQGDATVVMWPDGTAVLIDAGGLPGTNFDIAGRVVIPALRALQVSALHALVVTHGDPDHVTGAEGVLQRLRPASVWEGVPVPPHAALRALAARALSQGTVWRTVRPGDIDRLGLRRGEAAAAGEIRVLHPPEPDWERQRVRNDDSVVLEVRYGDVSILLPGDIGQDVERALIPRLRLGATVILKAAHHGSATSSSEAFLDATKPRSVIFSTGKHNRFKHPAQVVVERYAARGVEMFNTATDGAVFVETDGRSVSVRGWASRRARVIGSH